MKLNLSPSNNNVNIIELFKSYNNQYIYSNNIILL